MTFPEPFTWNGPDERGEPDIEGMAESYEDAKREQLALVLSRMGKDDLIQTIEMIWEAIYLSQEEPPDPLYQALRVSGIEWFQLRSKRSQ